MQTQEQRHYLNYERFEANKRFEEMTDLAERLGYPISLTISYEMKQGSAYCTTDTKERPFHLQTEQAKVDGKFKFTGDQAFEYTRLSHEHDEALMVDQLGRGELEGNILIKYSKIPDAVVSGETDISGYRRDLLRHFVRIYYRTDTGVECKLFTLDSNSKKGAEYAGMILGLDTSKSSEELLADYRILFVSDDPVDYVEHLETLTIERYDRGVFEETEKKTYAGSNYNDRYDAMNVIASHSHLVEEHMDAIAHIRGIVSGDHKTENVLESTRQRSAAAIKLASMGQNVGSISDTSVATEASNNEYGRDCATSLGMNQAQQNMENKWTQGECQVCFTKTSVGSCMVCARCSAADDRGVDLLKLRDENIQRINRNKKSVMTAVKEESYSAEKPRVSKTQFVQAKYGKNVIYKKHKTIGGEDLIVLDRLGEVIDKI